MAKRKQKMTRLVRNPFCNTYRHLTNKDVGCVVYNRNSVYDKNTPIWNGVLKSLENGIAFVQWSLTHSPIEISCNVNANDWMVKI